MEKRFAQNRVYDRNQSGIPLLGFAGWSGSGKTTLIEKLISELHKRGIGRIAVIKHDVHGAKGEDVPGTDTWRFRKAGACQVALSGPEALESKKEKTDSDGEIHTVLDQVTGADLILVEGFKSASIPQIGICRKENGKGFTAPLSRFEAVVTDLSPDEIGELYGICGCPVFGLDDPEALAEFISLKLF